MANIQHKTTNRVLVVDDDEMLINEYLRCLGEDFEPDSATATLTDLEKVLFGEETDEHGAARFDVHSRNQGEAAVEAIAASVKNGNRYAIVFIDIRMPPGIDGIEAAQRIRLLDPHVNIVIVTGSMSSTQENLGKQVPPADKIFFFQKPFHAMECRQLAAALCGKWHADMALRKVNEDLELRVEERTAALQKLAYFDVVTRLPNKLLLIEELKKLIEKAENTDGDTVAVLIDVERFSSINETMGYDAGTELLRSIGNRLSRAFCDEEGQRIAVVGRFGSDEFAVLVPGIKNESEMQQLAEMVKETVELPFLIDGRDLFLTVSVGVSWHPVHGRDAKSVFQCAESALHRSMRTLDKSINAIPGTL
jgi:diguanylate cyclase (GGDEF)-like protein